VESAAQLFNTTALQVTQLLQNGRLNHYIRIILVFVIGLLAYKIFQTDGFHIHTGRLLELTVYEVIIAILLVASVVQAVLSRSRTVAVAYMGVAGLAICLIFVFYSAPDLAMTQFTIDTLTVILFVLVLFKLPKYIPFKWGWKHVIDGFLALSFGTVIVALSLIVIEHESQKEISQFYAENSYLLAKGKNIVNVILVDFRGADTMIEIVVLAIAAIGVFSLLKLYIHDKKELNE
jgi:multicomponent Na+:H+ antiporter subunit A